MSAFDMYYIMSQLEERLFPAMRDYHRGSIKVRAKGRKVFLLRESLWIMSFIGDQQPKLMCPCSIDTALTDDKLDNQRVSIANILPEIKEDVRKMMKPGNYAMLAVICADESGKAQYAVTRINIDDLLAR